jgi:hypothetical protein
MSTDPLEFPILWKETNLRPSDKAALQQTQDLEGLLKCSLFMNIAAET